VISSWNPLFCQKKTALFILQSEVSSCHVRGTNFLFPETEVLLDEFFERNEPILPFTLHRVYLEGSAHLRSFRITWAAIK
jgi:hypothetical protein